MLHVEDEVRSCRKAFDSSGGSYETSLYAFSHRLGLGMMTLFPDVPLAVVFIHLAALAALLIHVAVTRLRRFVLIQQSRNRPSTFWSHLLHVLVGMSK